jgi:OPA family sugar phosphate sensor protein UhpC-like MFS transporter
VPEPLSPRQRRWRVNVFAATWMSYAGFYFCRKTFGIVKAPLKEILEVNDYELAHIWTAYLAAYMCGQFLVGWLGRRFACRALLLIGMMVSLLCNLAFGAASLVGPAGYWPFLIFMVVNGFAQSTGWPGNIGVLAHWFRRAERGTVIGFWATCYQLGSVGAKTFAAFMFGWAGIAWSFWGASVILLGVWGLFLVLQRDDPTDLGLDPIVTEITEAPAGEKPAAAAATVEEAPNDGSGTGWTPAVVRSVMMMGFAYFSFKFLRYALDSWVPLVLEETFDVSTSTAGYISTLFDWVGFMGVIAAGWATDRFFGGRRAVVAFALAVGMVLSTILLRSVGSTSIVMFAVSISLIGFTLYGPDSLLSGVGAIDVGSKRGAVLAAGIINGMGSAGPIVQEELIGYLKTHHSLDAVFALLVAVAVLGAVGTAVMWWWGRTGRSNF